MARILLIDDDIDVRSMLRLTLIKFGHTVTEARNGKEGMTLLAGSDPELVITDILMPEQEGISVVRQVRAERPAVRIIAISGGGRDGPANNLRVAKYLGADRVLAKPFSSEALMTAIGELLTPAP